MADGNIVRPESNGAFAPSGLATIFHVKPGREAVFDILSRKLSGVWTHWIGGRSMPCNSPEQGVCRFDHRPPTGGRRWQGWLYVWSRDKRTAGWVSLNTGTLKSCQRLIELSTLRGAELRMWRAGREVNSKLHASVNVEVSPVLTLPQAADPGAFLCKLWDIAGTIIPLGVEGMPEVFWPPIAELEVDPNYNPLDGTIWDGKDVREAIPDVPVITSKEAIKRLKEKGGR